MLTLYLSISNDLSYFCVYACRCAISLYFYECLCSISMVFLTYVSVYECSISLIFLTPLCMPMFYLTYVSMDAYLLSQWSFLLMFLYMTMFYLNISYLCRCSISMSYLTSVSMLAYVLSLRSSLLSPILMHVYVLSQWVTYVTTLS